MVKTASYQNDTKEELLADANFSFKNANLHLAVEVRENELLACLLNKHSNYYVAFKKFKITTREDALTGLLKDALLSAEASSISVAFTQNSSMLVPDPFFKKDLVDKYLNMQQLSQSNETACFDYIKSLDSYNLYAVNTLMLSLLKKHYPNAYFYHSSSIFMESVLIENKHKKDKTVFVYVFRNCMDVAVLKEGVLVLYNRFYYSHNNDFMYYLLWVYEQLALDNEKVPCVFYGDIEQASELYTLAEKYIKCVIPGEPNRHLNYANVLTSPLLYKYRLLFTQYSCI